MPYVKGKIRRNDKGRLNINHTILNGEFMASGANFSDLFPHDPPSLTPTYRSMALFATHIIPQQKIKKVAIIRSAQLW